MSHVKDVRKFNKKFGQLIGKSPQHLTQRKLKERADFLQEELNEFVAGAQTQNMPEMADALVDIVYVAIGTAVMMGLPWKELWDDVQRANMAKVRGVGKRGNLSDCIKPEGWEPPRTRKILEAYDYCGYDCDWEILGLLVDDPEYPYPADNTSSQDPWGGSGVVK